ncbi:hypothetical protein ACES2L_05945 [Bdellovibrio bacteriovorus]
MKFRNKPVVIEAIRFMGPFSVDEMYESWGSDFVKSSAISNLALLQIKTLEGNIFASVGDWIIKGVNGEFYPCKPDIFEKTYEAAECANE